MVDTRGDLVSSEASDTDLDEFELDLEDSFGDDLDSDEAEESSDHSNLPEGPQELGNTALIPLGNSHPFHSCSFCGSLEIDRENSSQWHMWAKLPVRPSQAPDECEFFRFCKEQYLHFPDSASLYMGIELKDGRSSLGCRVVFTFAPSPRIWAQEDFFTGRIHPRPSDRCNCMATKLRQKPPAKTFEKARFCMKQCEENHLRCPKREHSFTPLRLIRISSPTHVLLYSPDPEENFKYAVLSYCWGGPQQCETRQGNFAERSSSGMLVKDLSKTLQEALETCSKLGLQYLWADCLCIIQDNVTDKEEQIMQMPEIYAAAEITIAASCGRSTSEGFLETKAPLEKLFRFSLEEYGNLFVLVKESIFDDVEPLDTRAWALQEIILSIGVLNFTTSSLRFECGTSVVELDPEKPPGGKPIPLLRQLGCALLNRSQNHFEGGDIWLRLVGEYSRRRLTFVDDRLLAISGLADRFGRVIRGTYLAGLWEFELPYGLLWISLVPHIRPTTERAPSWTWASIDGPISYDVRSEAYGRYKPEGTMEVHSVSVVPLRMDAKYGSVRTGGLICVSSLFKRARVVGEGSERCIVDAKSRFSLDAKLHFDSLDNDDDLMGVDIFALNYYKTESLLIRQAASQLYTVGLLLVHVSDRSYRRVGLYNAGGQTDWFSNSSFETIYII